MKIDILVFGPHPDDIEIGIGGTVIRHTAMGYKVGLVDMTAGESGTNGTPEIRRKEALKAAEIMGVEVRDCLHLPDARLKADEESLRAVVEVIRRYKPKVVLGPYHEDRHPDHTRTAQLVREGAHVAGFWRWPADGEPHRPPVIAQYFLGSLADPSVVVDISDYYERKMGAICAHESQFGQPSETRWATLVNSPQFMRMVKSRDQYTGAMIQALYGEGLFLLEKQALPDIMSLRERIRLTKRRSGENEV